MWWQLITRLDKKFAAEIYCGSSTRVQSICRRHSPSKNVAWVTDELINWRINWRINVFINTFNRNRLCLPAAAGSQLTNHSGIVGWVALSNHHQYRGAYRPIDGIGPLSGISRLLTEPAPDDVAPPISLQLLLQSRYRSVASCLLHVVTSSLQVVSFNFYRSCNNGLNRTRAGALYYHQDTVGRYVIQVCWYTQQTG